MNLSHGRSTALNLTISVKILAVLLITKLTVVIVGKSCLHYVTPPLHLVDFYSSCIILPALPMGFPFYFPLRSHHCSDHDHTKHQRQKLSTQSGLRYSYGLVHGRVLRLRLLRPHWVCHRQLFYQAQLGLGWSEGDPGDEGKQESSHSQLPQLWCVIEPE